MGSPYTAESEEGREELWQVLANLAALKRKVLPELESKVRRAAEVAVEPQGL